MRTSIQGDRWARKTRVRLLTVFSIITCLGCGVAALGAEDSPLPKSWMEAWMQPPLECRPLQIVHGLTPQRVVADSVAQILQQPTAQPISDEGMAYYLRRGRGGIVCNVAFQDYLRSEANWQTLIEGVELCARLKMPVWIYDEKGYPSGAAGGLVLEGNPEFEALVLAWEPRQTPAFFLRRAFEHTHAANNYHAVRRYINLMDDRATAKFIQVTHEAYYKRLARHFGSTIVAFFTDEPSLMAVDLGAIPEPARSRVPIEDAPDPNVKPLPTVPWCYDLENVYRSKWGEDLRAQQKSLFVGNDPEDRRIRRQFWSIVAELVADRYFGALRRWCQGHNVASSGHNLHEESILHHVPLYGNGLKAIAQMDVPGLDMLSSNPEVVIHSGWLTAAMPVSGALLTGCRRVMTEVSDFSQKMSGAGPVGLPEMMATAAWQAAWGVTEFTLYYNPEDRSVEENWQYGQFVGRLNAILREAMPRRRVALYYPIYDLWAEYLPVAGPLHQSVRSEKVQQLIGSFMRLGQTMQRRQIPFVLIDHEYLQRSRVSSDGRLCVGNLELESVVMPAGVELPHEAQAVIEQFQQAGGRVIRDATDAPLTSAKLVEAIRPLYHIEPANDRIVFGEFEREGRTILILANVSREPYKGVLRAKQHKTWTALDPITGEIRAVTATEQGIPVHLDGYKAILISQ